MLNPINSIRNWVYKIEPEDNVVKAMALIPIISNIFMIIKERQYMKGFREHYVDPAKLAKAPWNSPLFAKSQKAEQQINRLSKISTTIFNWGQAQRIALIASIIFAPLPPAGTVGMIGLFIATQAHHLWSWWKVTNIISDYNQKALDGLKLAMNKN